MSYARLRLLLAALFVALALPTSVLVYQAYGQLRWEAFHQHQQLARDLTLRIDAGFSDLLVSEESRPFTDYQFLNVTGTQGSTFLQRSPLSQFPPKAASAGLLGYFQVDALGRLETPIVPRSNASGYGISTRELQQRLLQEKMILEILDENRLIGAAAGKKDRDVSRANTSGLLDSPRSAADLSENEVPAAKASVAPPSAASAAQGQAVFDELDSSAAKTSQSSRSSSDQVRELKLEDSYQVAAAAPAEARLKQEKQADARRRRKETANLPTLQEAPSRQAVIAEEARTDAAPQAVSEADDGARAELLKQQQAMRIQTFQSEVDAMEFSRLDSGHFVLFRRVWRDQQRFIQGLLIDHNILIDDLVGRAFEESSLAAMSKLIVAYKGSILHTFAATPGRSYAVTAPADENELLYQSRLITPFGGIELIYTLSDLPAGAGAQIITWSALLLTIVLSGGFLMLYRLGSRQIALAQQQRDFVSAVSHELKTPLTSIRMYGEMLRAGWVDETRRKSYYDFIFFESERLTRLINNVLQLARLSRNEQKTTLSRLSVRAALDELKPRLATQFEQSGYVLVVEGEASAEQLQIDIDLDWFIQIFINLVDNAIKFSAAAEKKQVDIHYQELPNAVVLFSVRDYGPGIAAHQMKKIFRLFFRSENELTRETVGTGIGLALVQQLATAMNAQVDVINRDVGAEFRIMLRAM